MTNTPSKKYPAYKGSWVQDFLVAVVFLTRLPIRPNFTFDMNALKSACRFFSLVGLIVGGVAGTIYVLAAFIGLPLVVCAILAVAAQIILTGALHEDAIGDVADGFGGGGDKSKKLEIMRDSRVGTYAVVTLIIVVGLKVAVLGTLSDPLKGFALLVVAATISRGLIAWALYFLPPARENGLGHGAGRPEIMAPLTSTVLIVLISILVFGPQIGAVALLSGIVGASIMGAIAMRQVGGQTGDVLGAIQQLAEVCILIACLAAI